MAEDCIFCRIVAGEAAASIAYEDDVIMAFMDLGQFHPGHTLVVPKRHIVDLFALDETAGAALMVAITRIAQGVRKAFSPPGLNIWQSSGAAAGQEVFHLHFHVLPRWAGDGLLLFRPPRKQPARAELDGQAAKIREALSQR